MESKSFMKMGGEGGPVEVDEAYVGGHPKNMHLGKRDHQIGKKYLMNPDGSIGGLNPDYKPHSITGVPLGRLRCLECWTAKHSRFGRTGDSQSR